MRLHRNWWVGALVLLVGAATFQNQASAQLGTANVHGTVRREPYFPMLMSRL